VATTRDEPTEMVRTTYHALGERPLRRPVNAPRTFNRRSTDAA
jgi:hypothetical protein